MFPTNLLNIFSSTGVSACVCVCGYDADITVLFLYFVKNVARVEKTYIHLHHEDKERMSVCVYVLRVL